MRNRTRRQTLGCLPWIFFNIFHATLIPFNHRREMGIVWFLRLILCQQKKDIKLPRRVQIYKPFLLYVSGEKYGPYINISWEQKERLSLSTYRLILPRCCMYTVYMWVGFFLYILTNSITDGNGMHSLLMIGSGYIKWTLFPETYTYECIA